MERTQIYLSAQQTDELDRRARELGTTRSHLIREAVAKYLTLDWDAEAFRTALRNVAGIWADRDDIDVVYESRPTSDASYSRTPTSGRKRVSLTIVDSSVLIDAIRGREPAVAFLERVAEAGPVWSSVLVRSELLIGTMPAEEGRIADLFGRIRWQEVTTEIADQAGRLGAPFRRSHRLGVVDLVIAATTIELGGDLATLNVRNFPMFPELRPPY